MVVRYRYLPFSPRSVPVPVPATTAFNNNNNNREEEGDKKAQLEVARLKLISRAQKFRSASTTINVFH